MHSQSKEEDTSIISKKIDMSSKTIASTSLQASISAVRMGREALLMSV